MHTPPFPVVLTAVALDGRRRAGGRDDGGPAARRGERLPRGGGGVRRRLAGPGGAGAAGSTSTGASGCTGSRSSVWPDPAPAGTARMAGDADATLTADWFAAFADEVDDMGRGEDQSAAARAKISHGRGPGVGGRRRAGLHRLQHRAGDGHGPDRAGLHAAGGARPRLRQRGDRGALAAPARGGGRGGRPLSPTSPIRCPIRSTSASATGRSKTGWCWRFRPISYRSVILRSPARAAYLKALCYLPGRFFVTFCDPLPLLPDTARHRRTGLVPA